MVINLDMGHSYNIYCSHNNYLFQHKITNDRYYRNIADMLDY